MQKTVSAYFKIILRIIITVLLLGVVLYKIDFAQFKTIFSRTNWWLVFACWAATLVAFWFRAIKMRWILKKQNCDVKTSTLTAVSAVASFYSLIMPEPLSSGVKWYILKKNTGKGTNVLSSMMYNQFTEIIVMMIIGFIGLLIISLNKNTIVCVVSVSGIALLTGGTSLLFRPAILLKIVSMFSGLKKIVPQRFLKKTEEIFSQIKEFQIAGWRFHLDIALITVVAGVASVVVFVLAGKAVGINVPVGLFAWQCILIYLLGRLPISLANLGVREFTLIEMLAKYNVPSSQALMMSMAIFSSIIFMAVIGGICQLWWIFRTHVLIKSTDIDKST
ncbi:MAG: lysylphosphatidylglycerol synthase transmembrane domain-containing protein [Phycisphaerae bacterium]|jgi:uncharacterized membrane protein YbhN (UPF0104 family)